MSTIWDGLWMRKSVTLIEDHECFYIFIIKILQAYVSLKVNSVDIIRNLKFCRKTWTISWTCWWEILPRLSPNQIRYTVSPLPQCTATSFSMSINQYLDIRNYWKRKEKKTTNISCDKKTAFKSIINKHLKTQNAQMCCVH